MRGNSRFAFAYPARFTAGRGGRILVEFVDLPRVATDGKDAHEAFEEAMDALGSDLSIRLSLAAHGAAPLFPPGGDPGFLGNRLVPVPLWLAPKLAVYCLWRTRI
jgi:hypothetical protein